MVPNGINPLNPLQTYYTEAASRAYETKLQRDQEGRQDDLDWNNLVQINIQGIYTRYCDVPMANTFYETIRKECEWPDSLQADDWGTPAARKPPTKPGWAIEVRGFTYFTGPD